MNKTIILILLLVLPAAYAQVYDTANLITDQELINEVSDFENVAKIRVALAALEQTEDIAGEAEYYYEQSSADIIIIYDFGNDKIAVAKPFESEVISDEKINEILDKRQNEKLLITDNEDSTKYLLNIITDLREELSEKEPEYGTCSVIKDGVCDENCYGDLDCECGNEVCDYHENTNTCPKDCEKPSDLKCAIISDRICETNCPLTDIDCSLGSFSDSAFSAAKRKRTTIKALNIIIGTAMLMLVAILIFILEKNRGMRRAQ
ncbi:hypothetical protein ACFL6I_15100 [candidate division KSB1 bacterium]